MSDAPIGPGDEQAVRHYLQFLRNPQALVDVQRVETLRKQAAASDDVIEQLKLLSEARRCEKPDGDRFRAGFVRAAGAFAEAHGIDPEAFVEIGVDRAVLVEAGVLPAARRASPSASDAHRTRQGRVDDVVRHIIDRTGSFTLADVAAAVPGSPMTIRKAVSSLIESGAVVKLGPVQGWSGQGRAPHLYRRKGTAG